MKTRKAALISALTISLFYSCKKTDLTPTNNTIKDSVNNGGATAGNFVYNLNKATLLQLVNNVRRSGCKCGATDMPSVPELQWNDMLAKAAYNHSKDMQVKNYFSHTGSDGSSPGDRVTSAGYAWRAYGENIARGYTTEQSVINGWLNSEGHCKNIMNRSFKDVGAGREGDYWTQIFGAK